MKAMQRRELMNILCTVELGGGRGLSRKKESDLY